MRHLAPISALAIALTLSACGTPQQQCEARAMRDLRVLDRQIKQTETDIARGYRLVEINSPFRIGLTLCIDPTENSTICADDDGPEYRRENLNIQAEEAKLASLREQRLAAEAEAARQIALCRAVPA